MKKLKKPIKKRMEMIADDAHTVDTDNHPKKMSLTQASQVINSTPYAIFIRSSPVYRTSESGVTRPHRPSAQPSARRKRQLPLRPDGYPYANEHWTDLMKRDPKK